jgi:hypothetical protein
LRLSAQLATSRGELAEARRLGEAAAELLRPLLGVAELSEVLAELADTCAKLGAPGEAARYVDELAALPEDQQTEYAGQLAFAYRSQNSQGAPPFG